MQEWQPLLWLFSSYLLWMIFLSMWFEIFWQYLVEAQIRTSRHIVFKSTLTFSPLLYPLMPKSCAGHNSHTVWDNLIMFGRDIYQAKKVCSMQEGQLLLCWFFIHINIQQVPLPLQGIYFLLLFLYMYTHKFKVFANIVYPVQIITSEVIIRWFWQKKKKK